MNEKIILRGSEEKSGFWVTAHELHIIQAIADGKTSKEIATDRSISPKTVEAHRYNMLKRLRCRNTPQLVAKLFRQALIK